MDTTSNHGSPDREERLNEIIAAYLETMDAGENPHREKWLARYPEFADDLGNFFAAQDQFAPLRPQRDPSRTRIFYVGDYELLEELGRGGMGVVHKARQVSLNRTVAVKLILDSRLVSEADIRRFHNEAEAAANLQHPNIVAVYEVGVHEGQHYDSMAYVEGKTLAALIREGPLPAAQAARYIREIAGAVHYAHQQGTRHRDLKPSNILIDLEDQPHITDFGLAKRVSDDSSLTTSGAVLGTPSYISPEQAQSKQEDIGPLTDVYALGATLYAALAGRPPFQSASVMDTFQQVIHTPPVSPRALNPAVPVDLETICLKCLEKEPGRRYGSAQEVADDLQRYLDGKPVLARPVGRMERATKWIRRNKGLSAGLAAAVMALLFGTVVATWQAVEARIAAQHEAQQRKIAENEKKTADTARASVLPRLYAAHLTLAKEAWNEGDVWQTLEFLREWIPKSGQEDLRGFEWHYLWRCCHSARLTVEGSLRGVVNSNIFRGVALSPDGQHVAHATGNCTVVVRDVNTGAEVHVLKTPHVFIPSLAYFPDGHCLAAVNWEIASPYACAAATVWDVVTGKEIYTVSLDFEESGSPFNSYQVAFNPNGLEFAFASGGGSNAKKPWKVTVVAARTGKTIRTLTGKTIPTVPGVDAVQCLSFSPDGQRIALATCYSGLTVLDAENGKELLTIPHPSGIRGVAFSPDGKRLASACGDGRVMVWDASSAKNLLSLTATDPAWIVSHSARTDDVSPQAAETARSRFGA
jgi:eukaryotic-like serine/threonine-protein kinase